MGNIIDRGQLEVVCSGNKPPPAGLDLFAESGGMSEGFSRAGLDVVCASDSWDVAVDAEAGLIDRDVAVGIMGSVLKKDWMSFAESNVFFILKAYANEWYEIHLCDNLDTSGMQWTEADLFQVYAVRDAALRLLVDAGMNRWLAPSILDDAMKYAIRRAEDDAFIQKYGQAEYEMSLRGDVNTKEEHVPFSHWEIPGNGYVDYEPTEDELDVYHQEMEARLRRSAGECL